MATKRTRNVEIPRASKRASAAFDWILDDLRPLSVPLAALTLDPANVRKHPERNMAAICASLRKYGQRKPIVVNRRTGVVEAGNGTFQAFLTLRESEPERWTHVAAVLVDDDDTTATGYAIADNRTAELADWDDAGLLAQLSALDSAGESIEDVGFSEKELGLLRKQLGEWVDEEIPDAGSGYVEQYGVIVICSDEAHQREIFDQLREQGLNCKVVTT